MCELRMWAALSLYTNNDVTWYMWCDVMWGELNYTVCLRLVSGHVKQIEQLSYTQAAGTMWCEWGRIKLYSVLHAVSLWTHVNHGIPIHKRSVIATEMWCDVMWWIKLYNYVLHAVSVVMWNKKEQRYPIHNQWCDVMWCEVMWWCDVMWGEIKLPVCCMQWCDTWNKVSSVILYTSNDVMWCDVMSCVMWWIKLYSVLHTVVWTWNKIDGVIYTQAVEVTWCIYSMWWGKD
jgi:hypothetical protein